MKMSDRRKDLRPREKLQAKGAQSLSDYELLMAIIGSGNKQADVSKIARDTLKLMRRHGADVNYDQLSAVTGMGIAKVTEILAALELSKRYLLKSEQPIIDSPEKAVEQLADIRDKKQEYFVCLSLDGANRLIAKRIITIGTLTSSLVHPREVFAHNHPSGTLTPSQADIDVTHRLKETGELIDIKLIDHILVTKGAYQSIKIK